MLSSFKTQDTLQGALGLFDTLGIKLNVITHEPADISSYLPREPKTVSDIFSKIARCWFIGTIDDLTLHGEDEALDFETEVSRIDEHYKGMVVFAIDVAESETLTRTEISAITRAFNRRSKQAPVALIVRRDDYISFAICERTPWARSDKTGEKPGKVLLLRNIYLPHPHRGHIDILRRMEVGNAKTFDDLYKQWMQVFDSDTLTGLFYKELQNWFFWAIKSVSFPNDVDDLTDDEKYNPENVIRLITRLVFVWFLLQKGLIPKEIFKPKYLKSILKNFDAESETSSQYYHTILQNLFFATLNRKIDERSFVDRNEYWENRNKGKYEIKTFLRHADELLISKEEFIALLHGVPFINNSLFECLDGKESGGKTYNWDGFSNSKKPQRQCFVPNKLFFAEEEIVDLSIEYERAAAKQTKVHGLINILKSFNFTVEENTPLDVDVALDPELLGKAFENLLALYNPETGKTVRKSTGSYYTPRPIVQYMVDESIVSYLLKVVPDVPESVTRDILGYSELSELALSDDQRRRLVEAVYNCRMLDPACGSGAFPMGILQQLSHLLSRIDTDNRYWEDSVMRRAMEDIEKASHLNEDDREATKADIQAVFNMSVNYPDYARKLYLIENCIYGVDIQSVAVQISRLRFFISLICEQQASDNSADNYGIRPLPNLEMKFVAANTLVCLADADDAHLLFQDDNIKALIDQLRQVRHQLFIVTDNHKKTEYLKKDQKLREKIAELSADNFADERQSKIDNLKKILAEEEQKLQFAKNNLPETFEIIQITNLFGEVVEQQKENLRERKLKEMTLHIGNIKAEIKRLTDTADAGRASTLALARQLTDWNPYDQNISSSFFDPDWMFGIKNGFDIVIGNPPYVQLQANGGELRKLYQNSGFDTFTSTGDLYSLFYERGWQLLAPAGILCFITSNKWMRAGYGEATRQFFATKTNPEILIDFAGTKIFESATVDTNILLFSKGKNIGKTKCCVVNKSGQNGLMDLSNFVQQNISIISFENNNPWVILSPIEQSIKSKIEAVGTPLKDWDIQIYRGVLTGYNEAFIITTEKRNEILSNCLSDDERKRTEELIRPILRGRDIKRYGYDWADLWLIATFPSRKYEIDEYPAVKSYLLSFGKRRLEQSGETFEINGEKIKARKKTNNKWFETQDSISYWDDFNKHKVIYIEIMTDNPEEGYPFPCFSYDDINSVVLNTGYIMVSDSHDIRYILGVLNSKLGRYLLKLYVSQLGERQFRMLRQFIVNVPIPIPDRITENEIVERVASVLHGNHEDNEINSKVYTLYKLSTEEISFIESL